MSPAPPAQPAEADFMAGLLQGLDASFHSSSSPSTSSPSASPSHPATPSTRTVSSDASLVIDLTDKPTYPATPKKGEALKSNPPNGNSVNAADVDMEELFAGAEDWDLDDFALSPRKPSPKKPRTQFQSNTPPKATTLSEAYESDPYTRCTVTSVTEIDVEGRWAKQLDVHVDKYMNDLRTIYLLDDWYDTDVRPGDIVNAIGQFDDTHDPTKPSIRITSSANLLILHPDILLTATSLSNAPQCARKPLLSSLVRASNDVTPALVWGNMLHEVMQTCLSEKRWEQEWINGRIDEVLINGLGMLLALNVSVETARTELRRRAIGLTMFKDRYIADSPKDQAVLSDTRARAGDKELLLAIPELHEIEEDIWSPKYGLKGKVDATVEAVITEKAPIISKNGMMNKYLAPCAKPSPSSSNTATPTTTSGPRPFEIKTGRTLAALEHRAQTMLYTLLASERYGTDVPDGLLYYTQSDTVLRVPRSRNEIRGLVVARNQLASYMIKRIGRESDIKRKRREEIEQESETDIEQIGINAEAFLPPPIDSEHACKKCYVLDTCMLYRYAYSAEGELPTLEAAPTGLDAPSGILDTYHLKTGHLTPEQGLFFRKWETLLSLEERDLVRFRRELWTMGAEDREKSGRCFAGMVIVSPSEEVAEKVELNAPSGTQLVAVHANSNMASSDADQRNLLNGHLNVGDPVTLSVEPHLLAFAQGYIIHLTQDEVKLGVDHRVDLDWIRARMRKGGSTGDEEVVFRIDKDELFGGMGRMRNNLAQLFYVNGDTKRLQLVVDLRKPEFTPSLSPEDLLHESETKAHVKHLNDSQRGAISKVLSAEDYALILGMPGTGKTTVIAALIKILVAQGKTVLLTSYTHSAVDTILRKLDEGDGGGNGLGFGVLRLGNLEKIHPDVRKYTIGARKKAETVEQLQQQWMSPPVVASTFDEASQITLPTCLGPLRFADKFILVGDHFQLPPLVKNPQARRGGLDVSLFRRLSDAHPDSVVDLREQYRMNEDIMALSNKLIYSDRLRCGSEEVAKRKLVLPNAVTEGTKTWLDNCHRRQRALKRKGVSDVPLCLGIQSNDRCWISHLTSPDITAVFVDTDTLGFGVAHDSRVGDLVQNEVEADLVVQLVQALVGKFGVPAKDVGVISL
ncbi:hypothetical protein NMY22_g16142 [Coprinellus aureogranulatus]|nr:hypothetical protein NMY22_g16142 [Coprinellus aureogranulatus]